MHLVGFVDGSGGESGVVAGLVDDVVESGSVAAGEEDEGLGLEVGENDARSAGEWMGAGDGDPEGFVHDDPDGQAGFGHGRAEKSEFDFPAFEGDELLRRFHFAEGKFGFGVVPYIGTDGGGEDGLGGGGDVADGESSAATFGGGTDDRPGPLGLGEGGPGLLDEEASGLGEFDLAAGADKQGGSQFLFKGFDLLAEGRLGDVQAAGGAAKVQFLRYSQDVTHVTQIHVCNI